MKRFPAAMALIVTIGSAPGAALAAGPAPAANPAASLAPGARAGAPAGHGSKLGGPVAGPTLINLGVLAAIAAVVLVASGGHGDTPDSN